MKPRTIKTILILTLIPEVLIIGFFSVARIQSPPQAGKPLAEALAIPYPAIVAHRGASFLAPEETRPAYLLARDLGADYLEGDVQRTKDGVLILLHDDSLERTTDAARIFPGREKETLDKFTFAELQKLDAGSWFNTKSPERARDRFKDLRIITVEEMLAIAAGGSHKPGIYLETKSPERFPGIEKQLVDLLKRKGWIGVEPKCSTEQAPPSDSDVAPLVRVACGKSRVIFQSFDLGSVLKLRELAAEVPRVYLVDEEMKKASGWEKIISEAVAADAGLGPVGYLGYPWYSGPAHRKNRLIHVYTINARWQYWLLSQFGADGFFTDRCELALDYFGRARKMDVNAVFEQIVF